MINLFDEKSIGNAVEVTIARCWCEALCESLSHTVHARPAS